MIMGDSQNYYSTISESGASTYYLDMDGKNGKSPPGNGQPETTTYFPNRTYDSSLVEPNNYFLKPNPPSKPEPVITAQHHGVNHGSGITGNRDLPPEWIQEESRQYFKTKKLACLFWSILAGLSIVGVLIAISIFISRMDGVSKDLHAIDSK